MRMSCSTEIPCSVNTAAWACRSVPSNVKTCQTTAKFRSASALPHGQVTRRPQGLLAVRPRQWLGDFTPPPPLGPAHMCWHARSVRGRTGWISILQQHADGTLGWESHYVIIYRRDAHTHTCMKENCRLSSAMKCITAHCSYFHYTLLCTKFLD